MNKDGTTIGELSDGLGKMKLTIIKKPQQRIFLYRRKVSRRSSPSVLPQDWKEDVRKYYKQHASSLRMQHRNAIVPTMYGQRFSVPVTFAFMHFADDVWKLNEKQRRFAFPFVIRVILRVSLGKE
ncbi:hypothetical protein BWQ96_03599 [Gracilariopsis chorda]|uniref:Uncharacterized protein n=1 Tax=Gracilariopsis chorda TaxID=448386 RepID=A0A2V3IZS6_9FLOR|nr:hypothetical protein BWQ96_03599 [Gracilariopsis chorda]|eukprot:PXF46610.1 hypothetical protein BWQ96_03599 [Gracilariopsis chorda]